MQIVFKSRGVNMKKQRVNPSQLKELLKRHDLQMYDICKICKIHGATAERWMKTGVPEAQFRLIKLSLGDL